MAFLLQMETPEGEPCTDSENTLELFEEPAEFKDLAVEAKGALVARIAQLRRLKI